MDDFWKIMAIILLQKLPKYNATFSAILKNCTFKAKPVVGTYWATLGEIGQLFIPTSGHTASHKSLLSEAVY